MDELYNAISNQIVSAVNYNNAFNAEQAQKQMDFQREMSNTAHVREIADLKAAGLNPVLSAKLGGASTPSGASASADSSGVTAIASLATEFMRQMAEGFASGAVSGYGHSAKTSSEYGDNVSSIPGDVFSYTDRSGVGTSSLKGNPSYTLESLGKDVSYTLGSLPVVGGLFRAAGRGLEKLSPTYEKYVTPALAKLAGRIVSGSENAAKTHDVSVMSYKRGAR